MTSWIRLDGAADGSRRCVRARGDQAPAVVVAADEREVPVIAPPSLRLRAGAFGTPAAALDQGRVREIARARTENRVSHVGKGHFLYDAPGSILARWVGGSGGLREGRSAGPPMPGNEVRAQARSYTDFATPKTRSKAARKTEVPAPAGAHVRRTPEHRRGPPPHSRVSGESGRGVRSWRSRARRRRPTLRGCA